MLEVVQQMATNLFTWTIIPITLAVAYGLKSWMSHPSDLPPMPCLPAPIFGHIIFMRPSVLEALARWRKQLGDIFTIYLTGKQPTIIINSYELLTEAFVKKADSFSDRPIDIRQKLAGSGKGVGITGNSKEPWKEQRSVSMSILRSFGMGKNLMAEKISEEIFRLSDRIKVDVFMKELSAMKGDARDIHLLLNAAVSNVICAIIMGERFDYDDPLFTRLLKQNTEILALVGPTSLLRPFPWLRFLPGDLFGAKRFKTTTEDLKQLFCHNFIEQFKDNLNVDDADNFIKSYLREMDKRTKSGQTTYLDEENLVFNIGQLFLAGTETTSTTILWALVFAMRFPEVQEKIFREIEEAIGFDRMPDTSDKTKTNYLNAFIMETQRVGSITPLALPRMCSKTSKVGGYTIPEGATIIPNIDAVLKDPKYWKDPQVFRPERFLDKDNKLVSPGGYFLPFSLGRRICMGESLAKMELFLFLSTMFQRFQILPEDSNDPPPLEGVFGITVSPTPFRVRFKERF